MTTLSRDLTPCGCMYGNWRPDPDCTVCQGTGHILGRWHCDGIPQGCRDCPYRLTSFDKCPLILQIPEELRPEYIIQFEAIKRQYRIDYVDVTIALGDGE